MNGKWLAIGGDLSAAELRRLARRQPDHTAAAQMQAIAGALEGMTRAGAARLAGMERQALRDAVLRYNAEGVAGLSSPTWHTQLGGQHRGGDPPRFAVPLDGRDPRMNSLPRRALCFLITREAQLV